MRKNDKKQLVPKLRFPEFRADGAWNEKPLSEVCIVNPPTNSLPETFVYIDLESVEAGKLLQKKIVRREEAPSRAQRLLKSGDVIFQIVRPYQRNNYLFQIDEHLDYVASTGYAQLRANESNMYVFQYIHSNRFVDRVLAKCTGSNYPAINSDDLSTITVEIPKVQEQQKIADCLTSLDELITAEAQKLDAYKAHKKGLMQKLFPAEGKTVPEWRFPEFRGYSKWNVSELGSLFKNRQEIGFVFLPLMSLTEQNGIVHQENTNRKNNSNSDKSKYLRICPGDVVYNTMRMWQGRCAYVHVEGIVSPAYTICKPNKEVIGLFFSYYFKTMNKIKIFHANSQGLVNDTLNLKFDSFSKILISYPAYPEQQKIADCLSSLDKLIDVQFQKIEALKAHKKGLMQGLFPSVEGVGL